MVEIRRTEVQTSDIMLRRSPRLLGRPPVRYFQNRRTWRGQISRIASDTGVFPPVLPQHQPPQPLESILDNSNRGDIPSERQGRRGGRRAHNRNPARPSLSGLFEIPSGFNILLLVVIVVMTFTLLSSQNGPIRRGYRGRDTLPVPCHQQNMHDVTSLFNTEVQKQMDKIEKQKKLMERVPHDMPAVIQRISKILKDLRVEVKHIRESLERGSGRSSRRADSGGPSAG
ncbi:hypothetical protein DPEC_G00329820 [Dallia pectoralis]|uniref:Uncharacterized protein n=1 Tax=Dallia pectoralis TaxID=75939 RepID=A0ACC2F8N0_DALPE|nr:hypothetical protein DPEC_G00329820 [Dallia pectoralis]